MPRRHLAFAYPAEGFPFYCDCAVILRESRRARLAHQFLDYLLRPEGIRARSWQATKTATANGAARRPAARGRAQYADALSAARSFRARGVAAHTCRPPRRRLRDRIWTEIKSA